MIDSAFGHRDVLPGRRSKNICLKDVSIKSDMPKECLEMVLDIKVQYRANPRISLW